MRLRGFAAAAALMALVVGACSSSGGGASAGTGELTKVTMVPQWSPQAQFCGYYAAKDKGFFKDQGLDVTILPGGVDIVPATLVAGGNAQFGVSWVPKLLASRESGADLQIIGMPFQRSGTLQIAKKAQNITKPEDWKGKKVGTWGFGNEAELYAAMRKVGIDPTKPSDVTIVPQDFTMTAFLNGDIDAAQAMTYNEYAQVLEAKNPDTGALYKPEDLDVVSMESAGTAMLQDAIFADESWLKEGSNGETATKFLTGVYKGWQFCRDNPDEAVSIVLAADAKLPKGHQTWQLNEINSLIWPSPNGIGMMDKAAFDRTAQIALDGAIIKALPNDTAWTNDYTTKALAALDGDKNGTSWQKKVVTLTEGGK